MPETLRPLALGELLDQSFGLYRNHFTLFVGIAAIPYLVLLAVQLVSNLAMAAPAAARGFSLAALAPSIAASLLVIVVQILAVNVATAATVIAVAAIHLGEPIHIAAAFRRVRGHLAAVIAAGLAVGFVSALGAVLLIVPGIILFLGYAVAFQAVVLEDLGPLAAMRRSRFLTKGFKGRIFLLYVAFTLIEFAAFATVGAIFGVLGLSAIHAGHVITVIQIATTVAGFFIGILVAPVLAIALSLLFFDLKVRKEAFDIQLLLRRASESATTSA